MSYLSNNKVLFDQPKKPSEMNVHTGPWALESRESGRELPGPGHHSADRAVSVHLGV